MVFSFSGLGMFLYLWRESHFHCMCADDCVLSEISAAPKIEAGNEGEEFQSCFA